VLHASNKAAIGSIWKISLNDEGVAKWKPAEKEIQTGLMYVDQIIVLLVGKAKILIYVLLRNAVRSIIASIVHRRRFLKV
jgi:hypothetical protein